MRVVAAAVVGLGIAILSAVVLGDYPISGSVPWLACVLVPFLIGAAMVITADNFETSLWIVTGPLAATSMAWGYRIATSWGVEPMPASAWVSVAVALLWPPAWAGLTYHRANQQAAATRAAAAARARRGDDDRS